MFQCKTLTKQIARFKTPVSNTISLYFVGVQVISDLRKAFLVTQNILFLSREFLYCISCFDSIWDRKNKTNGIKYLE